MGAKEFHKHSSEKGKLFFDDDQHIQHSEIYEFAENYLENELNSISEEKIWTASEDGIMEDWTASEKLMYMKGFFQGIVKWFKPNILKE